ncbi:hypothetical protein ACPCSC_30200 [Streptomyces lavendulocolor]|uniref:hypothetical protein n=1 Tax=Streptomyces lavendulocolor TaxID=67316 RepID=UPI003C2BD0FF
MTTAIAVAVDYRSSLLAFRAAIRAVRNSPGPSTLSALGSIVLKLPGGPGNAVEGSADYGALLALLERAVQSPHFDDVDQMLSTIRGNAGLPPSWTPRPYATEATAHVIRLLAVCHDRQADMEEHPLSPWSRAAEAGTRLLSIILRRTDARPADALMVRAAEEFADLMRTAIAYVPMGKAIQFAEYAARVYGLFPIGHRYARTNGAQIEWTRVFGTVRYRFELTEPGALPDFPHGRVTVRRSGTYEPSHTFALTARTRRKVIDQFVSSL